MLASSIELIGGAKRLPYDIVRDYDGFQHWNVLLVSQGCEFKAAKVLKTTNIYVYLPTWMDQVRLRGSIHGPRLRPVISGMLFVPVEMMNIDNRSVVFDRAQVTGFIKTTKRGPPSRLTKADIEAIRIMEAILNLPPAAKGVLFKIEDKVTFRDDLLAKAWPTGTVKHIASKHKLGVEVEGLFGRPTIVWCPASELEAA